MSGHAQIRAHTQHSLQLGDFQPAFGGKAPGLRGWLADQFLAAEILDGLAVAAPAGAAEAPLGMNEQPIHDAARLGTHGDVEMILKATPQARDARTPLGITPLHYAAMPHLKRWLNVPSGLESVQTAKVGNYFIEGRVLAVPGLPRGAPGREQSNPFCETACTILDNAGQERDVRREAYNTLLVGPDGKTSVFARH
jgi:hypothetical protein